MGELTFTDPPGTEATILVDDNKDRDFIRVNKDGTEVLRINKLGQLRSTAGCKYKYISAGLGDIAADSDAFRYPIIRLPYPVTINRLEMSTDTTAAADATNYQTIALVDADGNTIVSATTASTGFTAGVFRDMGAVTAANAALTANEGCYLQFTKAASGMALSGVTVSISYTIDATVTNANSSTTAKPAIMNWTNSPDAAEVILSDRSAGDHISFLNDGTEVFNVDVDGKIRTTSTDRWHFMTVNIGDIDVSGPTPTKIPIIKPTATIKVAAIWMGADTTVAGTGGDTNYAIYKFDKFDGSTTKEICQATTSGPVATGTTLTYGTLTKIADIDDGNLNERYNELTSADTLHLNITKAGTGGTDISNLFIQIKYEKIT